MKRGCVGLILLALLAPAGASGQDLIETYKMSRLTGKGNELYGQGAYDRARANYMRAKDNAGEKDDEAYRLHLNIGSTFYKEGNYQQAEKEFGQALDSPDIGIKEQASYNLGNTYFQMGVQAKDVSMLEKAAGKYQDTLEINPDNQDAKFNLEVVRRMIKREKEKPPPSCQNQNQEENKDQKKEQGSQDQQQSQKNQQQPDTGQNEQEQSQPQQQNQSQQGKDEQQKEKDEQQREANQQDGQQQKQPGSPEEKNQEQRNQQRAAQPDSGDGGQQQSEKREQAKPEPSDEGDLSRREAENLLMVIEKQEKEDMKKAMETRRSGRPTKEKDW